MNTIKSEADESPILERHKIRAWSYGDVHASEWINGEGVDIFVGENERISIHWNEFEALRVLFDALNTDLHTSYDELH
jgi:hypothetical protein